MADWANVKFYWDSMLTSSGATVTASSTESTGDYDVAYLHNQLEINYWKAASSATTTITCTHDGMLTDSGFETDIGFWSATFGGTGAGSLAINSSSPLVGAKDAKVTITNIGSAINHVRMQTDELSPVKKGKTYTCIFWCKAQAAQDIRIDLVHRATPWTAVSTNVTQAVTTSAVHYEVTFVASEDCDDARILINMGNGGTWLQFDDIVFDEERVLCADYALLHGHNFIPASGALPTVALEYSDDNSSWTAVDSALDGTKVVQILSTKLWEFTQTGAHKYWKWTTGSPGNTSEIQLLQWGSKTELDLASSEFDPHAQKHMADRHVSYHGYVAGVHEQFVERSMSLNFTHVDSTLYAKVKSWIENNGMKNFFVAWELANNTTEVFLMRSDGNFNNPLKLGGAYRNININLVGRKA